MRETTPRTRQHGPRPRRASLRRLGWGLILAGLLVLVTLGAVTAVSLYGHARSLQVHAQALKSLAAEGASLEQPLGVLRGAGEHLAGMDEDLQAIRAEIGPLLPAARLLAWLPEHGGDLAAAPDLLDTATGVSAAGSRAFRALSPALDLMDDPKTGAGLDPALMEEVLPLLAAAQPELQAARRELAQAGEARLRLDADRLSPRVSGLLAQLDGVLPWLETGIDGLLLAPSLLGAEGPRTYLILVQNNHELRATGGFLSGVGELHIEGGRPAPAGFVDGYAVDNFAVPHDWAPADLQSLLSGELWFFRDTNWDADFPSSARQAMQVYARDRGVQADGVIALDLVAVQALIDAIAPLQVAGYAESLSGATVLQVIQEAWGDSSGGGADLAWWQHRKDFMGPIANAAMDRLVAGKDIDVRKVAAAVKQALDEKHLLIYLADPQAAALLRAGNWDGALPTASAGDRLLVVDSNVGFNKVDAKIERAIDYRVDLAASEGPRARLTLTYRNHSTRAQPACTREPRYGATYADLTDGCYWDYLRVYVPAGSRLLLGPVFDPPYGGETPPPIDAALLEGDWLVWTAFIELAPGAEQVVTFEYRLPDTVLWRGSGGQTTYSLRVQKQPGTAAVPFHGAVSLPPGVELLSEVPSGLASPAGVSTDLRTDREFELTYREGGSE